MANSRTRNDAISCLDRALEIFRLTSNWARIGAVLSNLAILHRTIQQFATAVEFHQKAITNFRRLGIGPMLATELLNLAKTWHAAGDPVAAVASAENALELGQPVDQDLAMTIRRTIDTWKA
jgi:tetratricopeptide (TPR) repeat protein